MFVAPPGRKIIQFIEDTIWLNIFPTDLQDAEEVEEEFLDKTEAWEEGAEKTYTEKAITTNKMACLPNGIAYKFKAIKGRLYACGNIEKNEIIAPLQVDGLPTIIADKINYSESPNSVIIENMLIATKFIEGNRGGLRGEEITVEQS